MSDDVGAKKLGDKLLIETEVEDLNSVFKAVRALDRRINRSEDDLITLPTPFFGIPEIDALLTNLSEPIIELISAPEAYHPSGAGKTSLVYLIIAHAILPSLFSSSIILGGQGAAVIVSDPLNHISVSRLADVMLGLLNTRVQGAGKLIDEDMKAEMKSLIRRCMLHVHIFRPQSWASLLATLRELPTYLLDTTRHKSTHRRVHSIILEDVDAFTWSIQNSQNSSPTHVNPLSKASVQLTGILQKLSGRFSNGTVLSSYSTSLSAFRPALSISWPQRLVGARGEAAMQSVITRLAVRRVEVLKFAPAISIDEAEAERQQRWEVVCKGKFECWKVGVGGKDGEGFLFRVGQGGIVLEEKEAGVTGT